ncbi:hypothetical protein ABC382_00265 [Lysinibacillus sp. 1P01SD]
MECCQCGGVIDLDQKGTYEYDYVGDTWCKPCMKEEIERDS